MLSVEITISFAQRRTGLLCYYTPIRLSCIKQQLRGRLPMELYNLKALPQTVPPRVENTVLCPVRALKAYLSATADQEFVNSRENI